MPIRNRIAELHDEITGWRRHLHAHPELMYDVHETAAFDWSSVLPSNGR